MPKSKVRIKKYTPRTVKLPSLLNNLSVPQAMVERFNRDMQDRLLRLRLSDINVKDLASLVFSFAQAWMLTDPLNEADAIRSKIESDVKALQAELLNDPSQLSETAFNLLADLIELSTAVVAQSTRNEYLRACDRLRDEDTVEFVMEFLIALAKVKLLEVVDESQSPD
jgi:hypothetical protein